MLPINGFCGVLSELTRIQYIVDDGGRPATGSHSRCSSVTRIQVFRPRTMQGWKEVITEMNDTDMSTPNEFIAQ